MSGTPKMGPIDRRTCQHVLNIHTHCCIVCGLGQEKIEDHKDGPPAEKGVTVTRRPVTT